MLRPDRSAEVIELADGSEQATLSDLYRRIGCRSAEVVPLEQDVFMWLDEEGLLAAPMPTVNRPAIALAAALGRAQYYVGIVVYTGGADRRGHALGLSDERLGWLLAQLEQLGVDVARPPR
jgi:hypothetical protein